MSYSPNDTFDYELAGGRILVFRYGSVDEWLNYEADHERISSDKQGDTPKRLCELIARLAVGGYEVVKKTLSDIEAYEVAANLRYRSGITALEKKRSLSPSPTEAESSAPAVAPANA